MNRTIVIALAAIFLSGCGKSFYAFYGAENSHEFWMDQGCVQTYGTDCKTHERYAEIDARQRAATKRAIQGAR